MRGPLDADCRPHRASRRRWHGPGRRLYLQIYLGFLGVGAMAMVAAAASFVWTTGGFQEARALRSLERAATLLVQDLPPPSDCAARERRVREESVSLGLDLLVASPGCVARSWTRGIPPDWRSNDSGSSWRWQQRRRVARLILADGTAVVGSLQQPLWVHPRGQPALALLVVGLVVTAGCYPLARRLAVRLERVKRAAEGWGAGHLEGRAPVEGRDEVADLARAFNQAADRIEALLGAQKRLLASASHELRSPLARLRMALELLADGVPDAPDGARRALLDAAARDIGDLDELIGDLLLASRLQAPEPLALADRVDLSALVGDEGRRVGAEVAGDGGLVQGDRRMLRRMVRNLLENAARHGQRPIAARLSRAPPGGPLLIVEDAGPGIPDAERERIFEPFYRPAGHREGDDGGVGLGLALVRDIARRHGGSATCEPRPEGGTRFVVTLPPAGPA